VSDRASRVVSLIAVPAACAVLFSGPSREVAARKGAVDANFGLTSTTGVPDFWCRSEWKLYDPVEVGYLRFSGDWMSSDSCASPIPGVTIRTSMFPYGIVLENFPPGFHGPATLLTCDFEVLHWECPPTLEEIDQAFYEYEARDADGAAIVFPSICASELDCDLWPCGDPIGPFEADVCGDPNRDGQVSATDALMALVAAVSGGNCRPAQCDTDRSGDVAATDALRILLAGLVLPPSTGLLLCPAPCAGATTVTTVIRDECFTDADCVGNSDGPHCCGYDCAECALNEHCPPGFGCDSGCKCGPLAP
jgi:hypothetical protein